MGAEQRLRLVISRRRAICEPEAEGKVQLVAEERAGSEGVSYRVAAEQRRGGKSKKQPASKEPSVGSDTRSSSGAAHLRAHAVFGSTSTAGTQGMTRWRIRRRTGPPSISR